MLTVVITFVIEVDGLTVSEYKMESSTVTDRPLGTPTRAVSCRRYRVKT